MATQSICAFLADLYRGTLPRFFETEIPRETAATCADCAMLAGPDRAREAGLCFSPESKCCTYYPNLPNYSVGALLCERSRARAEGRRRLREAIRKRVGITPHGLERPRKYAAVLKNSKRQAFGRCTSLICPLYDRDRGACTIHPAGCAVCDTWFCKYVSGEDGRLFWKLVQDYIERTERVLVQYALLDMGWAPGQIMRRDAPAGLTPEDVDDAPPGPQDYARLWGAWAGREEAFYKQTYRAVAGISRRDFARIAGISLKVIEEEVKGACRAMLATAPPKRLKRNPRLEVDRLRDGGYMLVGYSPLDPWAVSDRIYQILDFFDGRDSNAVVCWRIRKQLGASPTNELLLALYRFRILVNADEEPAREGP